nr:MAG TPA: protein of unknown function (DUF3437) [Caudoviricetes sp.]
MRAYTISLHITYSTPNFLPLISLSPFHSPKCPPAQTTHAERFRETFVRTHANEYKFE